MSKNYFECNNCGFCCIDPVTQINLTLVDVKWLSEYTKKSVQQLFESGIISFVPFIQDNKFSEFEVELGMKKPCQLYKNNNCGAYDARPMNCRTFPYWLINHKIEDPNLGCIKGIDPDPITAIRYKEYERMVGTILLEQSEKTDAFMKKNKIAQKIDISQDRNFKRLKTLLDSSSKKKEIFEITAEIISIAEKKIDKHLNQKIKLIQEEINNNDYDKIIDNLIAAEVLLDGTVTDVNVR